MDEQFRHSAEEVEGTDVRYVPVRQSLRPRGRGCGVVRRGEDGDQDLRFARLAGRRVDNGDGLADVINEELLASAMRLSHTDSQTLPPLFVEFAATMNTGKRSPG